MFSVCIPVYRYDVRPLVAEIDRQAEALGRPVELLVYDDASPEADRLRNRTVAALPRVRYRELPRNLGRAAIRNYLAREARYPVLLLLDTDGWPNPDWLGNYHAAVRDRPDTVIVGGRSYANTAPASAPLRLHWWYGRRRESATASVRRQHPYLGFQSNNFLVPRSVLLAHPFPEDSCGYGHEDTLWGQQLERRGVAIHHLDNPVEHRGLEPAAEFLRKQRRAVENLRQLRERHPFLRTRLTRAADRLGPVARWLPEGWLRAYLRRTSSTRPLLLALDLLKLKWLN